MKKIIDDIRLCSNNYNYDTKAQVNDLGFSISVIGLMGKGKSTLTSCLKEVFVEDNIERIRKEMNDIEEVYYYVDFDKISNLLNIRFSSVIDGSCEILDNKGCKFNYINYEFKKLLLSEVMDTFCIKNGLYCDYINVKEIKDMFRIYIDDFYIINFRDNYVLSDVAMYSYANDSFSKFLSKKTLEIKQVDNSKLFYVERYLSIIQDEKSLCDGKEKSTDSTYRKLGTKQFKLLLRNASENTCRIITCKQRNDDEVITDRMLYTNNLYIESSISYNPLGKMISKMKIAKSNLVNKYMRKYKFLCFWSDKFSLKYPSFYSYLDDLNSGYKKEKYVIKSIIDFLNSQGFVKYKIYDYYNYKDVGSRDEKLYKEYNWVFPINICWGTVDSHEYRDMFDILSDKSEFCFMGVANNSFYSNSLKKKEKFAFLDEFNQNEENVLMDIKKSFKRKKKGVLNDDTDEYEYR